MRLFEGAGGHAAETVAELVALGDGITRGPKWHDALGAFNGTERGLALDLLGFRRQVVFSSFCATKIFTAPDDVRYAAAAAHNRSMAEFCAGDRRLLGVALVPLDEPRQALAAIDEALRLGLGAVWIPSEHPVAVRRAIRTTMPFGGASKRPARRFSSTSAVPASPSPTSG